MLVQLAARLVLLCLTAAPAAASVVGGGSAAGGAPDEAVDPYTRGDPAAMQAAGYVSFGPFPWAAKHTTEDIEAILGDVPMLWLETTHFRIGCSLPAYKVTNAEKRKIGAELEQLAERIPRVKKRTKVLDPWLRLHLFAQRIEDLHADFCDLAGVTDTDFAHLPQTAAAPVADGEPSASTPATYMGEGPCLGMRDKFTLLLCEKTSTLARYKVRFTQSGGGASTIKWAFPEPASLMFGTAVEIGNGTYDEDTKLHCHVVFNLIHNLVNGFKYYGYQLPVWLPEGLAHSYRRQIDSDVLQFSAIKLRGTLSEDEDDWAVRVRARVKHEYYPASSELLRRSDWDDMTLTEHMMIWSRVDFLLAQGRDRFAVLLDRIKDRPYDESGMLPPERILERQDLALREAYDLDLQSFDEAWAAWVLDTYPKK